MKLQKHKTPISPYFLYTLYIIPIAFLWFGIYIMKQDIKQELRNQELKFSKERRNQELKFSKTQTTYQEFQQILQEIELFNDSIKRVNPTFGNDSATVYMSPELARRLDSLSMELGIQPTR